jgi:undecaprenyl diphosphate synthase
VKIQKQLQSLEFEENRNGTLSAVPRHVAIIMDGNGRWAQRRGMPRTRGHQAGVRNIRHVVKAFADHHVKYLTIFAFSTENWNRPHGEVSGLMRLFDSVIDSEVKLLHESNVRVLYMGRIQKLSEKLQDKIIQAIQLTRANTGITLNIAFDYGARAEILDAVRRIVADQIPPGNIDEDLFNKYLYLPDIPDPDLIIRTGGQIRMSNFLAWQAIYSELYFTEVLWPDFDGTEIEKALEYYAGQNRRYGKL